MFFINHFVPYIICKGEAKSYAERAFHPSDYRKKKLKIDFDWYLSLQVMPPIARLCQHIKSTSVALMAQQLGLEGRRYQNYDKVAGEDDGEDYNLEEEVENM